MLLGCPKINTFVLKKGHLCDYSEVIAFNFMQNLESLGTGYFPCRMEKETFLKRHMGDYPRRMKN